MVLTLLLPTSESTLFENEPAKFGISTPPPCLRLVPATPTRLGSFLPPKGFGGFLPVSPIGTELTESTEGTLSKLLST